MFSRPLKEKFTRTISSQTNQCSQGSYFAGDGGGLVTFHRTDPEAGSANEACSILSFHLSCSSSDWSLSPEGRGEQALHTALPTMGGQWDICSQKRALTWPQGARPPLLELWEIHVCYDTPPSCFVFQQPTWTEPGSHSLMWRSWLPRWEARTRVQVIECLHNVTLTLLNQSSLVCLHQHDLDKYTWVLFQHCLQYLKGRPEDREVVAKLSEGSVPLSVRGVAHPGTQVTTFTDVGRWAGERGCLYFFMELIWS